MATSIIAKSEFRKNFNIQKGYGEVPGFMDSTGKIYYMLPDGTKTYSEKTAIRMAEKIDQQIRKSLQRNPRLKLH